MLNGEVWVMWDNEIIYTLHFKDFSTALRFCREWRKRYV